MVGPTKQFDENRALMNALDVFWSKGFEATSMQELVTAMGVNRASMYQTYGNKEALFNEAFAQYMESSLIYIKESLEASGSPLGNLKQLLVQLIDQSASKMSGCFVGNTAAELAPHNPAMAKKIREFWAKLETMFNNTLERAQQQNELDTNVDTKETARFINSTFQGLLIKSKANVDKELLSIDIEMLFRLIQR